MPLRNATKEVVEQLINLIEQCAEHFDLTINERSTIGAHARHVIDHLHAIQNGLKDGQINYNIRSRGQAMETDPQQALVALNRFLAWLDEANLDDVAIPVVTEVSISQQQSVQADSSLHRELAYVISHTVHHLAHATLLLKTIGIDTDPALGIAPATATHLREQSQV